MSAGQAAPSFACFVDAHVHIYPGYDLDRLVAGACANVLAAAPGAARQEPPLCYLLLSETARDNAFVRLRDGPGRQPGGWLVRPTAEPEALWLDTRAGVPLVIVAGRQIRTAEGLEVLALGTTAALPDDRPLDEAVRNAALAARLVVLPWGFGKWTGRRRRLVDALLAAGPSEVQLGDNRGRPALAGDPPAFAAARASGRRVLPGSDPLPLPGAERDVAAYGFVLHGPVLEQRPLASLLALLDAVRGDLPRYGHRVGLSRFLRDQLGLRLRPVRRETSAFSTAP